MSRRLTLALLAGALLAPAPAAADHKPGHAGGPGGTQQVTAAAPSIVTWGRTAVITGAVKPPEAGVTVELLAKPAGAQTFTKVTTAVTDAAGAYRFAVKPTVTTAYQVQTKGGPTVTSPVVTVRVRLRVTRAVSDRTPAAGTLVRFSGTVCPEHDGQRVSIQRRTATGSWTTVATTTAKDATAPCSSYTRRIRVRRDGVYRVTARPGDTDHLTGISSRIRLDAQ